MAYSSGGIIAASDYNSLATTLNSINAVGYGDAGYGQPAVPTIAAGATVTAAQWATLIGMLNKALAHQSSTSPIGLPTAGTIITYLSSVATGVNTAVANKSLSAMTGAAFIGTTNNWNPTQTATAMLNSFVDTNVSFDSADAARYFFNCGGIINFVCNATNNAGNARSQALGNAVNQLGGIQSFANTTNGGRRGVGGNLTTSNTNIGYRTLIYNTERTLAQIAEDAPYGGARANISAFADYNDTTNGANGAMFTFRLWLVVPADDAFGGTINLSVSTRADVIYPETTYLQNSWGSPAVISFDYA